MLRRIFHWVLYWSTTPYSTWALFILAFAESSFFPIPPDVLLITLAVAQPQKAFTYALVCSVGSVIGGCFGYLIGYSFMAGIGQNLIEIYGFADRVGYIQDLYQRYDAWAVGIAGFTPIPYKLFTIAAGMFKIDFTVFILTSIVSRSARFFLVSALIYKFGPGIQRLIERYFNTLSIAFVVLLILGFLLIKHVI